MDGGRRKSVARGGKSKMKGEGLRVKGGGLRGSPCVWLDLADSILREEWEELGDRFGRWSRLS